MLTRELVTPRKGGFRPGQSAWWWGTTGLVAFVSLFLTHDRTELISLYLLANLSLVGLLLRVCMGPGVFDGHTGDQQTTDPP